MQGFFASLRMTPSAMRVTLPNRTSPTAILSFDFSPKRIAYKIGDLVRSIGRRAGTLQPIMSSLPRVAILGRPNVGKSTLFNRICGRRRALVGNEPGMTRDRIYAPAEWMGKNFEVIDTGGMIPESSDLIASEIFRQVKVAIDDADQLVLVVDGRAGVLPLDEELARLLHRTSKPVTLAVNKTDTLALEAQTEDFRRSTALAWASCSTT